MPGASIFKAALLCATILGAPLLLATSPKGCDGFNGTWKSTWEGGGHSDITMVINGTTGTYDGGSLTGTVNGNVFSGTYKEDKETGTFKFTLASDGDSFVGQYVVNGTNDNGNWRGVCMGSGS